MLPPHGAWVIETSVAVAGSVLQIVCYIALSCLAIVHYYTSSYTLFNTNITLMSRTAQNDTDNLLVTIELLI